jgi:hypothetical protein
MSGWRLHIQGAGRVIGGSSKDIESHLHKSLESVVIEGNADVGNTGSDATSDPKTCATRNTTS